MALLEKAIVPRHLKHVSESSQVCQDYYGMLRGMEAQSDPGSTLQPDTFFGKHFAPAAHQQAADTFKRTQRLFGLEAKVLISSLTVYLLRCNLTGGHV